MPEVTVKILWRNKRRGEQFESLVELYRDGELMVGGISVSGSDPLSDAQIESRALSNAYPDIEMPVV